MSEGLKRGTPTDISGAPISADRCCANTDPPAPERWWVDIAKPLDLHVHVPWVNRHRPFVALVVSGGGYEGGPRGWRRILHVQLIWGRLYTDRSKSKVWQPRGRFGDD